MSEVIELKFTSKNSQATEKFAKSMGSKLKGGEIIELKGDIGAGKTTFVRGFVKGAGSDSRVSSPTFTVSNVYTAPNIEIHHYDFYRLDDLSIMQTELQEVTSDNKNVAILEWADSVQNVISDQHVFIQIKVTGEDSRELVCTFPEKYSYLKEAE